MTAVYPSSTKNFSYRIDYTELVEAGDVNVAYEEISAVQNTLGVNPQWDTIDGAVQKWQNVSQRISAVNLHNSDPFFSGSAHNISATYGTTVPMVWTAISQDTHEIYPGGGSNLVCPRTGIYDFQLYTRWHKDNLEADNQQPVFNRNGKLEIALQTVGTTAFATAQTGYFPVGCQMAIRQSASISMYWLEGTSVQMLLHQSCLTSPITATSICSISFRRGPATTNNL